MKRVNRESILIAVILLIALSVRIWGISYDLPYIYHPDEPWPIRIGHHMLVTGDFNPHFFDWPSLIIYINLLIQAIYYSIGKFFGFGNPLSPRVGETGAGMKAHSKWGRRRIADEIAKANNWVPLVSPSSVRRILEQAGLLPEAELGLLPLGCKCLPLRPIICFCCL